MVEELIVGSYQKLLTYCEAIVVDGACSMGSSCQDINVVPSFDLDDTNELIPTLVRCSCMCTRIL